MHYYEKVRYATSDLNKWLENDNRPKWHEFCRSMTMRYGFGQTRMYKMLKENYPTLDIQDDLLIKVA